MIDQFSKFGVRELSGFMMSYANIPYTRIQQLGIFPEPRGIKYRQVSVEVLEHSLVLLVSNPPGAPANLNERDKRKLIDFSAPQFQLEDHIKPDDVAGLRKLGSNDELEGFNDFVARIFDQIARKHAITREWLFASTLDGKLRDGDDSILINFHTAFGTTQNEVDLVLGTAGTDVAAKIMDGLRLAEDGLTGDVYDSWRVLASEELFKKLVAHPEVKEAFKDQTRAFLRSDPRRGFEFPTNVFWEEYRGRAPMPNGTGRRFITAGDALMFPMGTTDTFDFAAAPGDFNETVNQLGQLYYAKSERVKYDRGYDVLSQSNPLPILKRPKGTVRFYSSN